MAFLQIEANNVFKGLEQKIDKYIIAIEKNLPEFVEEVRKGIVENYNTPKSFDGSTLKPLALSTINRKRSDVIFKDKGILVKNSTTIKRKISAYEYEITTTPNRADAVKYNFRAGRRAFGINKEIKLNFVKSLTKNN